VHEVDAHADWGLGFGLAGGTMPGFWWKTDVFGDDVAVEVVLVVWRAVGDGA
jgi:hypothetical protein